MTIEQFNLRHQRHVEINHIGGIDGVIFDVYDIFHKNGDRFLVATLRKPNLTGKPELSIYSHFKDTRSSEYYHLLEVVRDIYGAFFVEIKYYV